VGRAKKPGAPGRTVIPPAIVSSVSRRLVRVFERFRFHLDHHLFIVPQQCYLYVEARRKEWGSQEPAPPMPRGSTTNIPLGRLRFMGKGDRWEWDPYSWSDEFWDHREAVIGSPEDLMLAMLQALAV